MRAGLDADTLALVLGGQFDMHVRLRVANGSGTLRDLSPRLIDYSLEPPNPNTPVGSLTVSLTRESISGTDSLAPLVRGSALNKLDDGVTYFPLLQIGTRVVFDLALTAEGGARPADASVLWYEKFRGVIISRAWPERQGRKVTIRCVDMAGVLHKRKSEAAYTYSAGTSLEEAIRQMLDNNGYETIALRVPTATGKVLSTDYAPGVQKTLWEQVWATAQSVGWLCWFEYEGPTDLALVLFEPPRSKTESDGEIPLLYDFVDLDTDDEELGNVLYGVGVGPGGERIEVGPVENPASLELYGGQDGIRRAFWIVLDETSPVRTTDALAAVVAKAAMDVADPDVQAVARVPPMPFVEVSKDLLTFPADDRFFDTPQDLAPFSAPLQGRADTQPYTDLGLRGRPSAGARTWKSKQGDETAYTPADSVYAITHVEEIAAEETVTQKAIGFEFGPGTYEVWFGYQLFDGGGRTEERVAAVAAIAEAGAVAATTSPGMVMVAKPTTGQVGIGYLVPKVRARDGSRATAPITEPAKIFTIPGPQPDIVRELIIGEDTLQLVPVTGAPDIEKVSFKTREGGKDWSAWSDQTAEPFGATVAVNSKHASDIAYRVYVTGNVAQERVVNGFDPGPESNVTSATGADDGPTCWILARFDPDTLPGAGSGRYTLDGGDPVEFDVDTERVGRFSVTRTAAVQHVEIEGKNSAGEWGPPYPIEVGSLAAGTVAGASVGLQVENRIDCDAGGSSRADYWTVDWAISGASDSVHAVQVEFCRDGVWLDGSSGTAVQTGLAPSAAGTTAYTSTFSLAQVKPHKVKLTVYEIASSRAVASVESLTFDNSINSDPCP